MELFILSILGAVFYFLSYVSPKTDRIMYGFSATLFLLAAMSGFLGFSDIVTGESVTFSYNSDNLVESKVVQNIYSESTIFSVFLPLTLFFVSLYLYLTLGIREENE